jgi:hypothetical protein
MKKESKGAKQHEQTPTILDLLHSSVCHTSPCGVEVGVDTAVLQLDAGTTHGKPNVEASTFRHLSGAGPCYSSSGISLP